MRIVSLHNCEEFEGGDKTRLRQLLHPDKSDVELRYSLTHATVLPGTTSTPHTLRSSEVYYILSGEGLMHINGEAAPVGPQQLVYIPPDAVQFITNTGATDLVFLCIVDPAWRVEDETVL